MSNEGINIKVEDFHLSKRAQQRVQTALHLALDRELTAVGHGGENAIFGDGSVKGMPAGQVARGGATRAGG